MFQETWGSSTYGEVTSNLSESANNWIGNTTRSSTPLHAFESYMMNVVEPFALRRREAVQTPRPQFVAVDRLQHPSTISSLMGQPPSVPLPESPVVPEPSPPAALVPGYRKKKKLEDMMKFSNACDILPCLNGIYLVRFAQLNSRPSYVHQWRCVNLVKLQCSYQVRRDTRFPCVHAMKAAIHHDKHVNELFAWDSYSVAAFSTTYNHQFIPALSVSYMMRDTTLKVPQIIGKVYLNRVIDD